MRSQFRPCIDLHDGQVKQIVGGTLHDDNSAALHTNFVSTQQASYYAQLYRDNELPGGHIIMLGPGNEQAATSALHTWPGGLQVGGGITIDNAQTWLDRGASKVIVTSWLFPGAKFSASRLAALSKLVGRDRLVVDLSCRRKDAGWVVAMDRWQTLTGMRITAEVLDMLAEHCSEFLVHAADVEGLCGGIDEELVETLGRLSTIPVTYAGGASSMADLGLVSRLSEGRVDLTIGSALDIFGGTQVKFAECVEWNRWTCTRTDALLLGVTLIVAVIVRCWRLSVPDQVVFDEVHFGKFAGKYINGTYFYDLHPPLAKMMFAAAGKLAGYDGVFDFKSIGLDYAAAGVPYVGMRLLPALMGALTVPATFAVTRACGYQIDTALLASLLVCFENGLVTQSRLILLDSPLVFFTVLSLTSWSVFWNHQGQAFSKAWWFWLLATGALMGCAASCKWVGLFLFPAIGLSTVSDLWDKIADRSISPARWGAHFAARAVGLLAVPFAVYVFWFQVHFALLHKTGDADSMMTPEFQTTLRGGLSISTDRDVFYGSEIRLRSSNANSGYLHSHTHNWQHDKGSGQQQITIYGHADENNIWIVEPAFNTTIDTSTPVRVKSGETLRLRHKSTGKFLHSHDKRPALTSDDQKFELSGYGFPGFAGDTNDDFRLDILSGDKAQAGSTDHLQAIYSRFRLSHRNLQCSVYNSRKKLPKWAFEQIEVNCMRNCLPRMSTWHVEYAHYPNATAEVAKAQYRPLSVWAKIWEYNKLMAESNESLTGDHPFAARPQHWAWLRRGTAYWGGRGHFVYQLGNPLVWWASFAAVLLFGAMRATLFLLAKRQIAPQLGGQRTIYLSSAGFFVVAWAAHYVPFFLMGRELFIHHYFPALWMAILVLAFTLDLFTARLPPAVRIAFYVATAAAVLHVFNTFSYITYSRTWTKDTCTRAMWLKTWDFDCEHAIGGVRATDPPPPLPPVTEPLAEAPKKNEEVAQPEQVALTSPSSADAGETAAGSVAPADEESGSIGNIADIANIGSAVAIQANDDGAVTGNSKDAVYVEPKFENPANIYTHEPVHRVVPVVPVVSVVSVVYSDVEDTGVHVEL
ncbi:Dolichyl-phosphate-mannose--protein mannosyltransferase 1 [Coemansia sp. BCRC 34301]|nr:Dolichyl-phosphate-mannose--protein mannosyltransferase 1 [Coemansia sp. BCRC 34301]